MTSGSRPGTAAIILAGGRARRLGGADKPLVPVAGRPLIEHALEAASGRERIVVVGGPFEIDDSRITWTREDPPFGGPASALIAGLCMLEGEPDGAEALVLAADLPEAVALVRILDAQPLAADVDGVVAVDEAGRVQWLAGRYRTGALRRAARVRGGADGVSMRGLLADLALSTVQVGGTAADLDTWQAIDEYRRAHPTTERNTP